MMQLWKNNMKKTPIVEIEGSKNQKKEIEVLNENFKIMKINLKKMHVQKKIWKPHGKTSLCWKFYCVNDNANAQIMCCIL
jgi:hypothetical protein